MEGLLSTGPTPSLPLKNILITNASNHNTRVFLSNLNLHKTSVADKIHFKGICLIFCFIIWLFILWTNYGLIYLYVDAYVCIRHCN